MSTPSPKFASLFSGCGGFDLGFLAKGFSACGAYDSDEEAINNYRKNVDSLAFRTDLTNGFPNRELLSEVDVLIAGPPCQGFSTAGKREIDDERNHLLTHTGTLALQVRPKALVVENVGGSLSGAHAKYFKGLELQMREAGYRTNTIICQAANLGMAQLRRRVLFFAWRTGIDIEFPVPNIPPKSLRSVLKQVSSLPNHHPEFLAPESREFRIANRIKPGQKLSNVRGGKNSVATWDIPEVFGPISQAERTVLELIRLLRRQQRLRHYGDADPVSMARLEAALGNPFHVLIEALIAKGYLRRIGDGVDLVGTFNGKFRRLSWDKPSYTVDTRFGSARYFLHPKKHRGFTVREAARIQGFEDNYVFSGNQKAQFRLIGNAVPPPLGEFAAKIVTRLLRGH
jgi:DNA (cytosine-5)-methyltransferase 1